MIYELRDDSDDLPILCATETEAICRGRRRAARICQPFLIYQMNEHDGECFIGTVD